jgi:hypothetical protein
MNERKNLAFQFIIHRSAFIIFTSREQDYVSAISTNHTQVSRRRFRNAGAVRHRVRCECRRAGSAEGFGQSHQASDDQAADRQCAEQQCRSRNKQAQEAARAARQAARRNDKSRSKPRSR